MLDIHHPKNFSIQIVLNEPRVELFFAFDKEETDYFNTWQQEGLVEMIQDHGKSLGLEQVYIEQGVLHVRGLFMEGEEAIRSTLLHWVRDHYSSREMHITRMFGSYILIQRLNGSLQAVKATPIPIRYCPLMVRLLEEVGGETAKKLLVNLSQTNEENQEELMLQLVNEVVLAGGYFDQNRPLNSCEANVIFGASEIMSSAFYSCLLDGAVIVSNNLGTIITTDQANTQGAVKRMTGLFYTSPSKTLMETAIREGIIPVFPYTAHIDQMEGVKKAIALGMKNIAVSFASKENSLLKEIRQLEGENLKIYRFGLCTTGIDEDTAKIMANHADIVWSCASKQVSDHIEPKAIAQVGMKIPVHIMTQKGWYLVKNHLKRTYPHANLQDVVPASGVLKPILLNDGGTLKTVLKSQAEPCTDCPSPCI